MGKRMGIEEIKAKIDAYYKEQEDIINNKLKPIYERQEEIDAEIENLQKELISLTLGNYKVEEDTYYIKMPNSIGYHGSVKEFIHVTKIEKHYLVFDSFKVGINDSDYYTAVEYIKKLPLKTFIYSYLANGNFKRLNKEDAINQLKLILNINNKDFNKLYFKESLND